MFLLILVCLLCVFVDFGGSFVRCCCRHTCIQYSVTSGVILATDHLARIHRNQPYTESCCPIG
jgi:hypothetical protein